jgi:hypothetical protein
MKSYGRCRNEAENSYAFASYECNKYRKIIEHDQIIQSTQMLLLS